MGIKNILSSGRHFLLCNFPNRKIKTLYCLSREADGAWHERKKAYQKFYNEISSRYTEIRVHKMWSERIGEYLNRYLSAIEDARENAKKGVLDVFVLSDCINHNSRLSTIMGREICLIDENNIDLWRNVLYHFPKVEFTKYWEDYSANYGEKRNGRQRNAKDTVQYFNLSDEEQREGQYKKQHMGLQGPYVCVSSRDPAYLATINPNYDCEYQDFRDSDINKFNLAAEYLSHKEITAVRMGRHVKNEVNFSNCIDYANKYYDELLDIVLAKDCKFYVGDSSGIVWLPMVLNRPIALRNWIPTFLDLEALPYHPLNLLIFKKYYLKAEERFLSVKEMMQVEKKAGCIGQKYKELGIEVVENSAEEILDLIVEMNGRVDGTWNETPEDVELQEKFQSIYKEWCRQEHFQESATLHIKIGAMFLRKNTFLLNLED